MLLDAGPGGDASPTFRGTPKRLDVATAEELQQILRTGRLNPAAECWKALPLQALAPALARGHPAFRGAGGTNGVPVLLPPPINRKHRARSDLLETLHSASSAEAETPRDASDIEDNLEPEPEPEPPLGRLDSAQLRLSMRKMTVKPPEETEFSEPRITFLKCLLERTVRFQGSISRTFWLTFGETRHSSGETWRV
jgi:hypothetical protein